MFFKIVPLGTIKWKEMRLLKLIHNIIIEKLEDMKNVVFFRAL